MYRLPLRFIFPVILFATTFSNNAFTKTPVYAAFLGISCLKDSVDKLLREARLYVTSLNRKSGAIVRRLAIIFFKIKSADGIANGRRVPLFGEDSPYRDGHTAFTKRGDSQRDLERSFVFLLVILLSACRSIDLDVKTTVVIRRAVCTHSRIVSHLGIQLEVSLTRETESRLSDQPRSQWRW